MKALAGIPVVVFATLLLGLPMAAQQSNPVSAKEPGTAAAQTPILTISQNPYPYKPLNFYLIKGELDQYFKELRYKLPTYFNSETTGFGEYKLWVRFWQPLVYPTGGDLEAAQQAITNYISLRVGLGLPTKKSVGLPTKKNPVGGNWVELGPSSSPASWHGRTEFISFDPQNANTILTGSPVSGLFYSDNSGATWSPGGMDFQQGDGPPLTSASHCIVNPTDSNTWFCATGDRHSDPLLDSGRYGTGWNQSFGIFRTTDRGVTWHYVGLFNSGWGWEIYELLADPTDPNGNVIYAATVGGLYKTTNAMDPNPGNVMWNPLPIATNPSQEVYDVEFQPGSSTTLYASGNITDSNSNRVIVQSTDAGASWTSLMPVGGFPANTLRVGMAVTPANPNLVYAAVMNTDPPITSVLNVEMYRFDASTNVWTDKGPVSNVGPYVSFRTPESIGVSPTDAGLVYLGEVYPAYCDHADQSGSCNWVTACSPCADYGGVLHTDMHQFSFSPDGTTVWAATDGGMFSSSPRSTTWSDQNQGLGTATIEGMATGANDPDTLLLGLYDDGTEYSSDHGSAWTFQGFAADGGGVIVNYLNSMNMYGTDTNNGPGLFITDDGWKTHHYRAPPHAATFVLFSVLGGNGVVNPLDPAFLYASGGSEVYRSHNEGVNWTQISSFGQGDVFGFSRPDPNPGYLAAPNPNYLYAFLLGSTGINPALWLTNNAQGSSPTWTQIPYQLPAGVCPPNCWPSGLALDPSDPDVFTLSYGGYSKTAPRRVFNYNPNNAQPWTDWTLNLPNVGIDSIVSEAGTNGNIYVGTYGGEVYVLNNSLLANGTNWVLLGTGLAHTDVRALDINYVKNKLHAGTFGRGMWETSLLCPDATDLTFSGAQGGGWYEAINDISSTAQVSGQVTYRAGSQITLGDGFSVTAGQGTQYRALIHGCGQ